MDLRLSLKNKINKNVIFCSFELVSVRRSDTFYQRLVGTTQDKFTLTVNSYNIYRHIFIYIFYHKTRVLHFSKKDIGYYRLFIGMSRYSPLFYAFTCHHNTSICNKNYYLPLDLIKSFSGNNILLHLTATDYKRNEIIDILRRAVTSGITNIFALQGGKSINYFKSILILCMLI